MKRENIVVEGHKGTWYVIDELNIFGKDYFLLEHETYGDDAHCVAINEEGSLVLDDLTEGVSELANYLTGLIDEIQEEQKHKK